MYSELFSSAHQIRYDCMCDRMVDNSKVLAAAMLGSLSLTSMSGGLKSPLRQIADKPIILSQPGLHSRVDRVCVAWLLVKGSSSTGLKANAMDALRRLVG